MTKTYLYWPDRKIKNILKINQISYYNSIFEVCVSFTSPPCLQVSSQEQRQLWFLEIQQCFQHIWKNSLVWRTKRLISYTRNL